MSDPTCTAEGKELLCRLFAWEYKVVVGGPLRLYQDCVRHVLSRMRQAEDATEAAQRPPEDDWEGFYRSLAYCAESWSNTHLELGKVGHKELVAWIGNLHDRMRQGIVPVGDLDLVLRQVAYREKHHLPIAEWPTKEDNGE